MKVSNFDLGLGSHLFFRPEEGVIQFMGMRVLLFDAVALGILRRELINSLGVTAARNIFTRLGYAHGWLTADNLHSRYPDLARNARCPPAIDIFSGVMKAREIEFDPANPHRVSFVFEGCYEAEQHLLHLGISEEPVCWTMTGHVSGYISRMLRREIYCIEHKCCGKGDGFCHVEGRTREEWGDALKDHLLFFQEETIKGVLKEVVTKLRRSEKRLSKLKKLIDSEINPSGIITNSQAMSQLLDLAKRTAKVDSPVVITGESGVGKELIARFIHDESTRSSRPFVAVNCTAITETLLESEFFGHSKGAFTGADRDRVGLFEAANGGTILLDEVGDMPMSIQAKLLRVLQEREVRRVGENKSRPVNVKIIAATNRDLQKEVEEGRFRCDLYYRLNVIELKVPPLRERTEDILPLARFFLSRAVKRMGRSIDGFSPEAANRLLLHPWPGNVRELQNVVERAVALCSGRVIQPEDLPKPALKGHLRPNGQDDLIPLDEVERKYIITALGATNGDKRLVAEKLNIGLTSLYRKLKEYGVR